MTEWFLLFAGILISWNFAYAKFHENKNLKEICEFTEVFVFIQLILEVFYDCSEISLPILLVCYYKNLLRKSLRFPYTVKSVLSGHLKRTPKIGFQYQLSLNAGPKYCRMLQGEHSAKLSTFIKLLFSIKTLVLSIFKWPLKTGFTVSSRQVSLFSDFGVSDLEPNSLTLWLSSWNNFLKKKKWKKNWKKSADDIKSIKIFPSMQRVNA